MIYQVGKKLHVESSWQTLWEKKHFGIGKSSADTTRSRYFRGLGGWESQLQSGRSRNQGLCPAPVCHGGKNDSAVLTFKGTAGLYMSKMTPQHRLIWLIICSQPNTEPVKVLIPRVETGTDRQKAVKESRESGVFSTGNLFKHILPLQRFFKLVFTSNLHPSLPGFIKQYQRQWLWSKACLHKHQQI